MFYVLWSIFLCWRLPPLHEIKANPHRAAFEPTPSGRADAARFLYDGIHAPVRDNADNRRIHAYAFADIKRVGGHPDRIGLELRRLFRLGGRAAHNR